MKKNSTRLTTAIIFIVLISSTKLVAQNTSPSGNIDPNKAVPGNTAQIKSFTTGEVETLTSLPNISSLSTLAAESEEVPGDLSDEAVEEPKIAILAKNACDENKIKEVLEPATASVKTAYIDCHLTLQSTDVVTKRLIFEGLSSSGVIFNGNGATLNGGKGTFNYQKDMIEVRSSSYVDINGIRQWERPTDITIMNCNIIGSVRIIGIAKEYLKEESRKTGYVAKTRRSAPKNIVFDHLTITGVGRNPVYFHVGVTASKLINSEIKGESDANAIYLTAESKGNLIKNNYIHTATGNHIFEMWDRPLIAIDGSSSNIIINNRFSSLSHGGIYLYRNCGEEGIIRHSTPSYNVIVNNTFYYDVYSGSNPAVYLSSKNAEWLVTGGPFGFCGDDAGYDFGSSKSDLDYARYNVVMQNQIYKRSVTDMIRTKNPSVNSPNFVNYNETVTVETKRLAGCYVSNGYQKDFIVHGESIDVFKNAKGEPVTTGFKKTCNDGQLVRSVSTGNITKVGFDCQVTGSNNGCSKLVGCPLGQKIMGATAAANLEYGPVSNSELLSVPVNTLKVVKRSDIIWEGSCFVGNNSLIMGQRPITGIQGLRLLAVGCKEHDKNGGDCDIKGILYCYSSASLVVNPYENSMASDGQTAARSIAQSDDKTEVEADNTFTLSVSPNPSRNNFKIHVQGPGLENLVTLRVYDFSGRLVELRHNSSIGQVVTLGDNYLPGFYVIEVISGKERKIVKVMKQ